MVGMCTFIILTLWTPDVSSCYLISRFGCSAVVVLQLTQRLGVAITGCLKHFCAQVGLLGRVCRTCWQVHGVVCRAAQLRRL